MNIKNLTKTYLNALPGLSESEKEKIANFNANSDYVAFSASSLKMGSDVGSTNYDGTGEVWTDYGAPKRVDEQGYVLVDLAEYNPWYIPSDSPVLQQRHPDGERFNLDGIKYRRNNEGFLESCKDNGEWVKLQHNFRYFQASHAKWLKSNFPIKGVKVDPFSGNHLEDVPLSNLLTEAWLSQHEELRGNPDDFDKIQSITFPEGAVGANVALFPWVNKPSYFYGPVRVAVLPRADYERDRYWITLKKSDLRNQRDPVDLIVGNFNFYPHDLQGKQSIKLFPDTASLIAEINLTPDEQNNSNSTTPPPPLETIDPNDEYSTQVIEYNSNIIELIEKLVEEKDDLTSQGIEKFATLMSLEKDEEREVKEQMDIINEEIEVDWLELKEEGQANHDNNQQVEARNKTQIDNCKKLLARKKEAVKKLETIINQANCEEPTDQVPKPAQKGPSSKGNKTPVVENNKNSQENIEELSRLSLSEAKIKAKEEISTLLDRYGVKTSEMDTKLWEKNKSWEEYLGGLNDNETVTKFVKKMKSAIINQNSKNNQAAINLPLTELKHKSQNHIQELLTKYHIKPNDLDQTLWNNEKSWEEYLENLSDNKAILNFTQKIRESIINKANQEKNKKDYNKPNNLPLPLLFFSLSVLLLIFLLGIVAIRKKRKKVTN